MMFDGNLYPTTVSECYYPKGGDALTHWGLNKMVDILQTTFSNVFFMDNYYILIQIPLQFIPMWSTWQ